MLPLKTPRNREILIINSKSYFLNFTLVPFLRLIPFAVVIELIKYPNLI